MNVTLHPSGLRNRQFRPYIEQEELSRSVYLYNPEGPGFNYGLYDQAQPSCGSWLDIYEQYPSKTPFQVIDDTGRLHSVEPDYATYGYCYEPLMRHVRPSGIAPHQNC